MQRKLPGIDIPAATEAKILHAAAFLEFKGHVERLAREGSDLAAYTCWMHGVEVLHSPCVLTTGTDSELFPPLPKMPCCVDDCKRCAAHIGGFKFPWLGLWNSRGVVLPDDVAPADAWDYYYQHQDPMDLLLVAAYTSFKVAADVVPQDLYGLQLRCTAGDAGQLGLGEVFEQWRTWLRCMGPHELLPIFIEPRLFPRAARGRPWPVWGREGARAHRALCGWLEGQDAGVLQLGTACTECGDPTRRVCWSCCVGCVVPASPGGSHVDFVEDVRRCLLKVDIMTEAAPLKSPQHLFALRTLAILIGCSAMASGGKGYYAAQAAASSSSGGDPAPGWRAADSLMMIAAQRARQWREGEGLLDDNDFAYAYTDYDQVVGLAGHHVADDWLQTRPRKSSLQLGPKSWRTTLRVR